MSAPRFKVTLDAYGQKVTFKLKAIIACEPLDVGLSESAKMLSEELVYMFSDPEKVKRALERMDLPKAVEAWSAEYLKLIGR